MQRASNTSNSILVDDDGRAYGFVLAADYVSEHEWGIRGIQGTFGIAGGPGDFVDRISTLDASRTIRTGDLKTMRHEGRKKVTDDGRYLTTDAYHEDVPTRLLSRFDADTPFTGAFDEGHFAIGAYSPEAIALLDVIHQGVAEKDLAIWMGGSDNPFGRGGLVVARASLVPRERKDAFDAAAKDKRDVKQAGLDTGIAERIKAGIVDPRYGRMPYFALSPAWITEGRESAHPVMFWLNPSDQTNHAYGWFTVEELDEWIAGRGPVIENSTAAQGRRKRA